MIALVILNLVRSRFLSSSLNFRLTIILEFSSRFTLLFLLAFLIIGTRESHQCDFLVNSTSFTVWRRFLGRIFKLGHLHKDAFFQVLAMRKISRKMVPGLFLENLFYSQKPKIEGVLLETSLTG